MTIIGEKGTLYVYYINIHYDHILCIDLYCIVQHYTIDSNDRVTTYFSTS